MISESKKTAAFCFHDLGTQEVLHACFVTSDRELYIKFAELYEKLWAEDIIMEIDFSLGRDHVLLMKEKLSTMKPIEKRNDLSPLENIIIEAKLKIKACELMKN